MTHDLEDIEGDLGCLEWGSTDSIGGTISWEVRIDNGLDLIQPLGDAVVIPIMVPEDAGELFELAHGDPHVEVDGGIHGVGLLRSQRHPDGEVLVLLADGLLGHGVSPQSSTVEVDSEVNPQR
jgi:hypothetical protein